MDGGATAEGGDGGGGPAVGGAILNGIAPPPFLSKTYDMVDDPATDSIVSWGRGNNSFVVWSAPEFARDLLPKYFKHNNFSSFVRQLNTYGFKKVDPDRWEFANEGFLKGQKHLLKTITRRKATHVQNQPQQTQAQNNSVGACVEVGNFGLEEEIERLKRDKNVLMQELVRLRQQQQSTDHQLQTLGQRLQGMEQRQQQMMSFLAKAMQSPGFLAQLVQQNDNNRRIVVGNKKRRLPRQDNKLNGQSTSPDGQIIKYQPLMNEAAKAMLRQILKADTSMLDTFSNFDSLVLENFPSSLETLDNRSTPSRNSGVTLSEVSGNSTHPHQPVSSAFSAICSSPTLSEIQSPTGLANMDTSMLSGVAEAVSSSQTGISIPDFPQIPEMVPNSKPVDVPVRNYAAPEAQNVYVDALFAGVDRPISIETEGYSVDTDFDILIDEDQKLPGINDSFWEQFLKSPVLGEAEEADSSTLDTEIQHELENGWDSSQNLKSLTEQMELLASGVKM